MCIIYVADVIFKLRQYIYLLFWFEFSIFLTNLTFSLQILAQLFAFS